jgi:ABC-type proline/glycine betaine transport system substrate-binding protein
MATNGQIKRLMDRVSEIETALAPPPDAPKYVFVETGESEAAAMARSGVRNGGPVVFVSWEPQPRPTFTES